MAKRKKRSRNELILDGWASRGHEITGWQIEELIEQILSALAHGELISAEQWHQFEEWLTTTKDYRLPYLRQRGRFFYVNFDDVDRRKAVREFKNTLENSRTKVKRGRHAIPGMFYWALLPFRTMVKRANGRIWPELKKVKTLGEWRAKVQKATYRVLFEDAGSEKFRERIGLGLAILRREAPVLRAYKAKSNTQGLPRIAQRRWGEPGLSER